MKAIILGDRDVQSWDDVCNWCAKVVGEIADVNCNKCGVNALKFYDKQSNHD